MPGYANLITSILYTDEDHTIHLPLIDLDVEHAYFTSSSEGHGHLYLNVQLNHEKYGKLLDVLYECGIIEKGIIEQYKRLGYTNLRLPGLKKGLDDD